MIYQVQEQDINPMAIYKFIMPETVEEEWVFAESSDIFKPIGRLL